MYVHAHTNKYINIKRWFLRKPKEIKKNPKETVEETIKSIVSKPLIIKRPLEKQHENISMRYLKRTIKTCHHFCVASLSSP